jgi:hypothetical protein
MQKVSVVLDEQGIPAMGDLVTKTVVDAICHNFNALRSKGFVTVKLDYIHPEHQEIFGDDNLVMYKPYAIKPMVTLIPTPSHQAILQIEVPK